jgi:hypothetical protein
VSKSAKSRPSSTSKASDRKHVAASHDRSKSRSKGPAGETSEGNAVAEQRKRGRKPAVSIQTSDNPRTEAATVHLTPGKLNAVRAAFKVGVKPSKIVRQALASDAPR